MRFNPLRVLLVTLLAGVLLGIVTIASLGHLAHAGLFNRFANFVTGRATTIDTSSPSVVEKIRQLSRLESVVYSLDKIVEGERKSAYIPDFLVGDKLILVAHGDVIAGVDLQQLKPADVSVNGDAVHVHLPAAQVFTTRIDNGQTKVYSRITGLLVNPDINLESQVRQAAEQQMTQAALDDGILSKASTNARAAVTALLYGLGFHKVDVE
ncbi:MAG: DUF4230 domain-containing protein [Terracidiphilus sp.]|jgi:hypothetical protein